MTTETATFLLRFHRGLCGRHRQEQAVFDVSIPRGSPTPVWSNGVGGVGVHPRAALTCHGDAHTRIPNLSATCAFRIA